MDKNELIKIAVTAVIAIIAREVVAFTLKHSTAAANIVKPVAIAIFKRHWMIIPVFFDGFIFIFSIFIVLKSMNDETPATKKFVFWFGLALINTCFYFARLTKDAVNYLFELRRTRPPKE